MAGIKFLGMFIPTVASKNSISVAASGIGCEKKTLSEMWSASYVPTSHHKSSRIIPYVIVFMGEAWALQKNRTCIWISCATLVTVFFPRSVIRRTTYKHVQPRRPRGRDRTGWDWDIRRQDIFRANYRKIFNKNWGAPGYLLVLWSPGRRKLAAKNLHFIPSNEDRCEPF